MGVYLSPGQAAPPPARLGADLGDFADWIKQNQGLTLAAGGLLLLLALGARKRSWFRI